MLCPAVPCYAGILMRHQLMTHDTLNTLSSIAYGRYIRSPCAHCMSDPKIKLNGLKIQSDRLVTSINMLQNMQVHTKCNDKGNGRALPGDNPLALFAYGRLKAARSSPRVEPVVVNVPQVHAHQPETQGGVLYRGELELHLEVDSDQHPGNISREDIASPHGIGGVRAQACHHRQSMRSWCL